MTGNERGTDSTGEAPSGRDPERGGGKPGRAISVSGLLMPIATVVLAAAIVGVLVGAIIDGGAVGATALAAAKDVAATYVRAPVLLLVSALLPLCLWAAVASSGRERIGGPDALPPVPVWAWACLVFCTGAAAGLVVWGVAEPLGHFRGNPHLPREQAETAAAIGPALRLTLFHWGLHPWAILTAAGLAVAIGATRSGIGTRPAAGLWPLAPRLAAGPAGRLFDLAAAVAGLVGLVLVVTAGTGTVESLVRAILGPAPPVTDHSVPLRHLALAGLLGLGIALIWIPLDRGLRWIAVLVVALAALLCIALLAFGPSRFLLDQSLDSLGDYIATAIPLGFRTFPVEPATAPGTAAPSGAVWQSWWTLFYWLWWLLLAPALGGFLALLARGRSVRAFVAVTLLLPAGMAAAWILAFGGTALYVELLGEGGLQEQLRRDPPRAVVDLFAALRPRFFGLDGPWLPDIAGPLLAALAGLAAIAATVPLAVGIGISLAGDRSTRRIQLAGMIALLLGTAGAAVLLLAAGTEAPAALRTAAFFAGLPAALLVGLLCLALVRGLLRPPARE